MHFKCAWQRNKLWSDFPMSNTIYRSIKRHREKSIEPATDTEVESGNSSSTIMLVDADFSVKTLSASSLRSSHVVSRELLSFNFKFRHCAQLIRWSGGRAQNSFAVRAYSSTSFNEIHFKLFRMIYIKLIDCCAILLCSFASTRLWPAIHNSFVH